MSKESKNISKARRVIRKAKSTLNPQQVVDDIRTNIPNARLNNCKYLAGITRMYLNNEFCDQKTAKKINDTLKLITIAHADEYDNNLNGMTANTLIGRFNTEVEIDYKSDVKAHNSTQFIENKRYKIYRADNFEKARKFSPYTSWCVTKNEESYNSYTGGGSGLFYFCIRDDFKMTNAVQSDGCPLDNYGLSMIATSVDEDGKCNTITCRWNHDNNGNDGIMTPMQLSKLIGRNYYEVFKPYTKEELYAKGLIPTEDVQMLLDNGKNPSEIFTKVSDCGVLGLKKVCINGNKWNILNVSENRVLYSEWYRFIGDFIDEFAIVQKFNGKWNFIKKDGKALCSEWYNYAENFIDGLAKVTRSDLEMNYIKPNGKSLCSEWYYYIGDFIDGFAIVKRDDDKWNFINSNGDVLCHNWYDYVGFFHDGFAVVRRGDSKYNLIKPDGSVLSDEWYDYVGDFKNGFAEVQRGDEKWNFIKTDGSILCKEWYRTVYNFKNGFAMVENDEENFNFINKNGDILCSDWYKDADNFVDGFGKVKKDDEKWHLINEDGSVLSPEWYAITFEDDTDKVLSDNR